MMKELEETPLQEDLDYVPLEDTQITEQNNTNNQGTSLQQNTAMLSTGRLLKGEKLPDYPTHDCKYLFRG